MAAIAGRRSIRSASPCWCGSADCWDHSAHCYACGRMFVRRGLLRWMTVARSAEHGPIRRLVCVNADSCA